MSLTIPNSSGAKMTAAQISNPRAAAFDVVRQFENALAEYTGAPHVVTVDSCTNAIFLSLLWWRESSRCKLVSLCSCHRGQFDTCCEKCGSELRVGLPRRTYVGVAQSALNAGFEIEWRDEQWKGWYVLTQTPIVDSARRFHAGMYLPNLLICVSFQIAKHLPIGRGGAILTDNADTAAWLRRARFDGRTPGDNTAPIQMPGYHMYMTPPDASRGLWLLSWMSRDNEDLRTDDYPDLSLIFGEPKGGLG